MAPPILASVAHNVWRLSFRGASRLASSRSHFALLAPFLSFSLFLSRLAPATPPANTPKLYGRKKRASVSRVTQLDPRAFSHSRSRLCRYEFCEHARVCAPSSGQKRQFSRDSSPHRCFEVIVLVIDNGLTLRGNENMWAGQDDTQRFKTRCVSPVQICARARVFAFPLACFSTIFSLLTVAQHNLSGLSLRVRTSSTTWCDIVTSARVDLCPAGIIF